MSEASTPTNGAPEPTKDPIVDRVYDYTKWHIALYGAVLGFLAVGISSDHPLKWYWCPSVAGLTLAGVAAGTLASCLSRREKWTGFLTTKTFPLVPDRFHWGLTMQMWMQIQHASLWFAILWGVSAAIISSK